MGIYIYIYIYQAAKIPVDHDLAYVANFAGQHVAKALISAAAYWYNVGLPQSMTKSMTKSMAKSMLGLVSPLTFAVEALGYLLVRTLDTHECMPNQNKTAKQVYE